MGTGWTDNDIGDLDGRTAIVTGANSGLGWWMARSLAAHGAHVVMACRNHDKASAAADEIRAQTPDVSLEIRVVDVADLGSIRRFANDWGERAVDILINNAGVMATPKRATVDGFELQIGTNYLGAYALTGLLLPALEAAPEARVVAITSFAAYGGRIALTNLNSTRHYQKWVAYSQSKLADVVFANELERRARAASLDLISLSAHPGYSATHLQSVGPQMSGRQISAHFWAATNKYFAQAPRCGSWPALYAATAPDMVGGLVIGPDQWQGARGHPRVVGTPRAALDPVLGRMLWDESARLTGVDFGLAEAPRPVDRLQR